MRKIEKKFNNDFIELSMHIENKICECKFLLYPSDCNKITTKFCRNSLEFN